MRGDKLKTRSISVSFEYRFTEFFKRLNDVDISICSKWGDVLKRRQPGLCGVHWNIGGDRVFFRNILCAISSEIVYFLKIVTKGFYSLRSKRFCGVREQRITALKMERVKEGGGGGEGRKETLADKPLDFENRPLGLSRLSAHTEISSCHRLS